MLNGVTLQAQSPASAHADLGFVLGTMISGKPMAMREAELEQMISAIAANRFVLPRNRETGARITDKGTAIVELHGVLIDRSPYFGSYWGMQAYEVIEEQCRRLATNADVKRVVLDINSPGGMVLGIDGAGRALADLAEKKPLYAIANNMACSAGYWLASVADEVSVTPNGEVGSIGVITSRVSYAEMLEREGITARIFSAGAAKADNRIYSALSPGEAAETQYGIDRDYDRFVSHVAAHRGMSEDAVRDTDARCFCGDDAVSAGLADRIETLDELVTRIEKSSARAKPRRKPQSSSKAAQYRPERTPSPSPAPADSEPSAGKTTGARRMTHAHADGAQTDLSAIITATVAGLRAAEQAKPAAPAAQVAPAAAPAAAAQPTAEQAAEAERTRIMGILALDEAKTRPALARTLAANPKLSLDEAKALLAAAAAETSEADATKGQLNNALEREMAKPGNSAGVKPDGAGGGGAKPSLADKIASKFATAKKGA